MIKRNASAEIELYPAALGGFASAPTSFPVRLLARAAKGDIHYGFVVLQGQLTELPLGMPVIVDIAFLNVGEARRTFGQGEWIAIGEPTKVRGRMRVKDFS